LTVHLSIGFGLSKGPKQVYASEQFTLSAWYAMSSALKMTGISERETKSVITVCLSTGFGQSIGQIMAQVLMKNRKLSSPQMLLNAIQVRQPEFLSGWYAISKALLVKRTGISERQQKCFYCFYINWLSVAW
jgi:3-oxoacyl-(acyl-carrier-protein) synthase